MFLGKWASVSRLMALLGLGIFYLNCIHSFRCIRKYRRLSLSRVLSDRFTRWRQENASRSYSFLFTISTLNHFLSSKSSGTKVAQISFVLPFPLVTRHAAPLVDLASRSVTRNS